MTMRESLEQALAEKDLGLNQFQTLIQRLLDYGIICRDESQVEAELYDLFLRIETLVDEYLAFAGIRYFHEPRFEYVRLVPPGSQLPGVDDETEDAPFNQGLRAALPPALVAVVMVLAVEYEKALREARVDERGLANLSLEALSLSLKNLLGRSLPDALQERKALFRQMRQLRLVRMSAEADLLQGDSWLQIRPMILTLVSPDVLSQIEDHAGQSIVIGDADDTALESTGPRDNSSVDSGAGE
ncbi:DUF4194 domain-containing protein [Simiduia agarivorans]|uniref:DUF4194 domain-containing protein n=1 Tax=Simiduia agarivorans (strain DSM 21679 / JCM 13881 / BCRC 17597 / SA1) TaxID=1117647 RepID=K4KHB2_SIMAS|nr:DUF4194 domain-containing protein [Simiduia agarivorans]AFU97338.1 hypothetical protein M5M_00505 [Simiduia agarivorans SA1 = DSM 21679]